MARQRLLRYLNVIPNSGHRAGTTIVALAWATTTMVMNQQFTDSHSRGKRFAGIVLVQSINFTPHPLNVAWMAINCRTSEERAVAMAM